MKIPAEPDMRRTPPKPPVSAGPVRPVDSKLPRLPCEPTLDVHTMRAKRQAEAAAARLAVAEKKRIQQVTGAAAAPPPETLAPGSRVHPAVADGIKTGKVWECRGCRSVLDAPRCTWCRIDRPGGRPKLPDTGGFWSGNAHAKLPSKPPARTAAVASPVPSLLLGSSQGDDACSSGSDSDGGHSQDYH